MTPAHWLGVQEAAGGLEDIHGVSSTWRTQALPYISRPFTADTRNVVLLVMPKSLSSVQLC